MAQGYTTSDALIAWFGSANVLSWANVNAEAIAADGTPTSDQAAAIAAAIADAETHIHEALAQTYALPFASPFPPSVQTAARQLAAVYLYAGMRGARDDGRNEQVEAALQAATTWLRDVKAGRREILSSSLAITARKGSTAPTV